MHQYSSLACQLALLVCYPIVMSKRKKKLKKTINSVVNETLEQMKFLNAEDRFARLMEVGEWIFCPLDTDEELLVPQLQEKESL